MFSVLKLTGAGFVEGAGFVNRSYSTKRFTNEERSSFSVTPHLQEVIIGLSLGDLHIDRKFNNSRLMFQQGLIHEAYIINLYDLFKDFCGSPLKYSVRKPDLRTGKIYSRIMFNTYALPCFNYYHELFYVDRVKIIPKNIGEILTPISLAYWAMDDGNKKENAFYLNTDSYTFNEVELLIKVLKQKFDLNCTYHKRGKDSYRIYIKFDSMTKFKSLVAPHFHDSMMYKLIVNND